MMKTLKSKLKKIYDCVHSHKALAFLLAMAYLLSCEQPDFGVSLTPNEISVRANTLIYDTPGGDSTAATKAPVPAGAFPAQPFVMSASHKPSGGSTSTYFSGMTFSQSGDYWFPSSTKYWPKGGQTMFLAYSAQGLSLSPSWNANAATGFTVSSMPDNRSQQTDIMYAGTGLLSQSTGAVSLTFKHAQSLLLFTGASNVAYNSSTNVGVTVTGITMSALRYGGSFSLSQDEDGTVTPTWSASTTGAATAYSGTGNLSTSATDLGTGFMVYPQSPVAITINYTLHNGKDASGNAVNLTRNHTFTPSGSWAAGTSYTYAISFTEGEISVSASLGAWEAASQPWFFATGSAVSQKGANFNFSSSSPMWWRLDGSSSYEQLVYEEGTWGNSVKFSTQEYFVTVTAANSNYTVAYTKKRYIDHIRVEPSTVNLLMATTEFYAKAYAVWSDGTEEDVTSQATWSNQGYRTSEKWSGNYFYQFRFAPTGESHIRLNIAKNDNYPGRIRLVSDKDVTSLYSLYAAGFLPANIMRVEYAGFTAYMYGTFNVTSIVFSMYINGAWVSSGGPYEVRRKTVIPMRAEATDGTVTNDLFNIISDGVIINGTRTTSYTVPNLSTSVPTELSASFGGVTSNTVKIITTVPTFAGLEIAPAPLYYDGENFIIKDYDWNHHSYNSVYGMAEGSYYFNWSQCHEVSGVTYDGCNDWRMPTHDEWVAVTTGSRTGSTINGTSGCRYALISLTGVTFPGNYSSPVGLLLAPDGETMTGMSKVFTWNVNSTSGNTDVTAVQLDEYLDAGCVFLPAFGYRTSSGWIGPGSRGSFWSSSEYNSTSGYYLYFTSSNVRPSNNYNKDSYYFPCRLVRTAE